MSQLQAYDQNGQPMPLVDFSYQTTDFGCGVIGITASQQMLFTLINRLVESNVIDQAGLTEILGNYDLSGYSIAVVS
jgi:hypothetical protein